MEAPWTKTRGDLGVNERCDKIILPKVMIKFYGKRWKKVNRK